MTLGSARPFPPNDGDEAAWRAWAEALPLSREFGMVCEAIGRGQVTMVFEGSTFTKNPNGAIHGGLVLAAADQAMGIGAMTTLESGFLPATATLNTSFLRPSFGPLTFEVTVPRSGRTLAFVEAVVTDGRSKQCAACAGTWSVNGSAVPATER